MARLVEVTDPADVQAVRELFAEYAREVDEPRDTLPRMGEAMALYRSLGFRETAAYLPQPTPGSLCFELKL